MHFELKCDLVDASMPYSGVEVLRVHYDVSSHASLSVDLSSESHGHFRVSFDRCSGLRVIDEGQICEFWNTYSQPNGWLWVVQSGGWFDLESQRQPTADTAVDVLRESAFKRAFAITDSTDACRYISDDLGLLADASRADISDPWLVALAASYASGAFPHGELVGDSRTLDVVLSEFDASHDRPNNKRRNDRDQPEAKE